MAEIPEGAELVAAETLRFPAVIMRNVVRPARRAGDLPREVRGAARSGSASQPIHLCSVFVSIGEGTLAEHLNAVLGGHPQLHARLVSGVLQPRVQGEGDPRVEGPELSGSSGGGLPRSGCLRPPSFASSAKSARGPLCPH